MVAMVEDAGEVLFSSFFFYSLIMSMDELL